MAHAAIWLPLLARGLNEGARYVGEIDAAPIRSGHHLHGKIARSPDKVAAASVRPDQSL
jgi:hypothetical protein